MHSNETRIYIAVLTSIILLAIVMVILIVIIINYQKKKVALYRIRVIADINMLEKERGRISADLHDDFGPSLSGIKIRLHCLEHLQKGDTALVAQMEALIDEAMEKLKQTSFGLMPPVLKRMGLRQALEELIFKVLNSKNKKVNFIYEIENPKEDKAIHMYRIAQEILNNISKHSNANVVNISLIQNKKNIEMHIKDDGTGFDKNVASKRGGLGMHNIVSRVDILKAKMHLDTGQGLGSEYFITIPNQAR